MKTQLRDFQFRQISIRRIHLGLLILLGCMTLFCITCGHGIAYFFKQPLAILMSSVGLIYFGTLLSLPMERTGRNLLLLGLAFCLWPLIIVLFTFRSCFQDDFTDFRFLQCAFAAEYLMCLPFGCIADEKGKNTGLKIFSFFFILGSLVITAWGYLFIRGYTPAVFEGTFTWAENSRMNLGWHRNVVGRILFFGIGFSLYLFMEYPNRVLRVILGIVMAGEYLLLTLLDSKATDIICCCLFAGVIFFLIFRSKRTPKRFLAGLLAAAITVLLVFSGSTSVFLKFFDYRMTAVTGVEDMAQLHEMAASAPSEESGHGTASGAESDPNADLQEIFKNQEYRFSASHYLNMGNRLSIWQAVFRGIRANPRVLLLGTEHIGEFISNYHTDYFNHAHNAWLQTLLGMGLVGFLFTLVFTFLAIRYSLCLLFFRKSEFPQKIISILMLGTLMLHLFEPFLFYVTVPSNFINMAFLLCLGYLAYWNQRTEKIPLFQ